MRLGIDFGTTRIVVAVADRGNYPVVAFEAPDGSSWEWFPPLIAAHGVERLYGWDAWAAQTDPRYTVVRSLKRTLEDAVRPLWCNWEMCRFPCCRCSKR